MRRGGASARCRRDEPARGRVRGAQWAAVGLCLLVACSKEAPGGLDAERVLDGRGGEDARAAADAGDDPGIDAFYADAGIADDAGTAGDLGIADDVGIADDAGIADDVGFVVDGGVVVDAGQGDADPADVPAPIDAGPTSALGPYDRDGLELVTEATIHVDTGMRSFDEHVFIPGSPGPHPLVSVSPGLQQRSAAYVPYLRRLASHGIIAISHDDFGALVQTTAATSALLYLVGTWLPAMNADAASPLFGKIDVARVGLGGHSRGGKASLIAAETAPAGQVVAWFGIDPIDAATLSGGVDARDTLASLHLPLTFLGATVSGACSPAPDNYEVLYAAANAPAVKISALNAGHVAFEDPAECRLCALCNPAGSADPAVVLAYSLRYVTAYFARELLFDRAVGAAFEGAGAPQDQATGLVTITSK